MRIRLAENFRAAFYAPFYATLALGFYEKHGVTVELVSSSAAGEGVAALLHGKADVTWGGPMRVMKAHDADPASPLVCFGEVVARDPFYLVAANRWLEDKKIEQTPELTRALRDMIVDSSNEATQYVVDVLTHTTGGYELPPKEMEEWQYQRNAVNRYFSSLGYTNINVNQKTFCEDAYGRERVSRGPNGENRNKLTTDATARLMMEIVTGKIANPTRTAAMMELLKREYAGQSTDPDNQGLGFTGIALKGREGFRLWSKAGWTSTTRHDVAYVEMPDGGKFVLATFTSQHANEREIIPTVARVVIDGLKDVK